MSTLYVSDETHQQVLLQPAALEDTVADNLKGTDETDCITILEMETGVQHGRGETPNTPVRVLERHPEVGSPTKGAGRKPHAQPLIFVLSKEGQPLDPTSPARARRLLRSGRAVVVRRTPFVIRLKDRSISGIRTQGVLIGIDPGSKTTGIAIWKENTPGVREAIFLAEIEHRSSLIKKKLFQRAAYRKRRRSQNLRYRAPRFLNRTKLKGWLPPSFQHRVDTTVAWVERFSRWAPVQGIVMELVRFDTQLMQNPAISRIEYQQGELAGYEIREYLLEKWARKCAYCDIAGVPLQTEHIVSKARGGSNRVSNLTLSCEKCNKAKGSLPLKVFLAHDPVRLTHVTNRLKIPLKDAAAVNSTRLALWRALTRNFSVSTGTGGQTKYNRTRFNLPKRHTIDALCVGYPATLYEVKISLTMIPITIIHCLGRGQYQRTTPNQYGFPRLNRTRKKAHYGFQTGDIVRAVVPKGKNAGTHNGRVVVRASGSFSITTYSGKIQGINKKYCTLLQRGDGYGYYRKYLL